VQRCQIHKRRDVKEYLPENCQKQRSADAQCVRDEQLCGGQRGVAENLPATRADQSERCPQPGGKEGLKETLTVHRLGVRAVLRRELATTNPIESCLSTVQRVARNVKRWREGNQPLCWTATGLLEAE
jgi:putative transposase